MCYGTVGFQLNYFKGIIYIHFMFYINFQIYRFNVLMFPETRREKNKVVIANSIIHVSCFMSSKQT